MKVYQYSRISTEKQSLAQQQLRVKEFLDMKGWELTATIAEEDISGYKIGYKDRRLTELLDMMQEGDILVVSELSRLCRKMSDMSKLINEDLKPRKLRLIIVSMNIDLQCDKMKAIDELIINNFAFAAQCEAEMLHDRINAGHRANMQEIAETGGFTNRRRERCEGGYAAQYGKHTHTTHAQSCEKARAKRAENQRKKAQENPNNEAFRSYVALYEERNGYITPKTDVTQLTNELNRMKLTTSTGLPFNNQRARAMLDNVRKLYAV